MGKTGMRGASIYLARPRRRGGCLFGERPFGEKRGSFIQWFLGLGQCLIMYIVFIYWIGRMPNENGLIRGSVRRS